MEKVRKRKIGTQQKKREIERERQQGKGTERDGMGWDGSRGRKEGTDRQTISGWFECGAIAMHPTQLHDEAGRQADKADKAARQAGRQARTRIE